MNIKNYRITESYREALLKQQTLEQKPPAGINEQHCPMTQDFLLSMIPCIIFWYFCLRVKEIKIS